MNADISERTYNILQWRKWKEQTSLYKLVEEAGWESIIHPL